MSRGSNFWGTARGKLGNMVISNVKGQQVERKYQPQVENPKTFAQMRQRAVFASAVKFFKHSQQNLFKFAFEDKTQRESDYNAFMRHNVRFFTPTNKVACDNPTLPALGFELSLQLSFGSLPSPTEMGYFNQTAADGMFGFNCGKIEESQAPDVFFWSDVSRALVENYGLENGDIITFVVIRTNMSYGRYPAQIVQGIDAEEASAPAVWALEQKRIDLASNEDVSKFVIGKQWFCTRAGIEGPTNTMMYFGSVIFSRNIQGRKLMVSTSTLSCSTENQYNSAIPSKGSAEERQALLSWGANPEAVLKGSLL